MKHKNLTVNKLAFGNLKARKKQYTLMIIGIVLAMIFSSGTLFFVSCFQSSREEQARRESGNFWGYFYQPKDYIYGIFSKVAVVSFMGLQTAPTSFLPMYCTNF